MLEQFFDRWNRSRNGKNGGCRKTWTKNQFHKNPSIYKGFIIIIIVFCGSVWTISVNKKTNISCWLGKIVFLFGFLRCNSGNRSETERERGHGFLSFATRKARRGRRWGGRIPSRTGRGDEISAEWPNDRRPTYAHEYEQQNSKKFGFGYQVEILDIVDNRGSQEQDSGMTGRIQEGNDEADRCKHDLFGGRGW